MSKIDVLTTPWWTINDKNTDKLHQEMTDTPSAVSEEEPIVLPEKQTEEDDAGSQCRSGKGYEGGS